MSLLNQLEAQNVPRWQRLPEAADLMHASTGPTFTHPDWIFELKYDGIRTLVRKSETGCSLMSRKGNLFTNRFPEVVGALNRIEACTLDGEIAVCDNQGRPIFTKVLQRNGLASATRIAAEAHRQPATLFAFDVLTIGPYDVRSLALTERKFLLHQVLENAGPTVIEVQSVEEAGEWLLKQAIALGLEGIVGKRKNSKYSRGRSASWVKSKNPDWRGVRL